MSHLPLDMEKLYRIEEEGTDGWSIHDPSHTGMTQEQTEQVWKSLIGQGVNPSRLRIIREQ